MKRVRKRKTKIMEKLVYVNTILTENPQGTNVYDPFQTGIQVRERVDVLRTGVRRATDTKFPYFPGRK